MKIAIYGIEFSMDFLPNIQSLFQKLEECNCELYVHRDFANFLDKNAGLSANKFQYFDHDQGIPEGIEFLFSLGGDGTFLESVRLAGKRGIPIIGINTGRLGFLANIARDGIEESLDMLFRGNYTIEERSLIQLDTNFGPLGQINTALNEVTIHKKSISMITIQAELDGEFLNSYWADGLIISTPTGSTAYSMSVGGPIVYPGSESFIISPVSPHNLTVRPLVIPDRIKIKLKVLSRSDKYLVAIDSRSYEVDTRTEIYLSRASYCVKMVNFPNHSFYNTIRNKLMWGADRRN